MTIDEIETFVSIARLGGFARAAEGLHRSQPAISRRVEMLEEQLRTPVFERVRGGVVLTEAGRAFLPYAEAVLASLKDGTEAVRGLERGERGAVSVVLVGTLASTKFASMLRQFGQRHPHVKLELRTANSQEVSDLVRRGEATLGLRYFTARSGLVSEVVMRRPGGRLLPGASPGRTTGARPGRPRGRAVGDLSPAAPWPRALRDRARAATRRGRIEAAEIVRIDSLTRRNGSSRRVGIALLIESSVRKSCVSARSRSSTSRRFGEACR